MNEPIRDELLAMDAEDQRARRELLDQGALGDGYHPRMESVHKRNAARLKEIISQYGWPGRALLVDEGAFAACGLRNTLLAIRPSSAFVCVCSTKPLRTATYRHSIRPIS